METEKKESKALPWLVDLVQEQIAKDPYERDGKLWCKDAYSLAPVMGISERTLRRLFKDNPTVFKLQTVLADSRRVALVRLAEEGEPAYSPTQEAAYLAKMWESRIGRDHTRPRRTARPAAPGMVRLPGVASSETFLAHSQSDPRRVSGQGHDLRLRPTGPPARSRRPGAALGRQGVRRRVPDDPGPVARSLVEPETAVGEREPVHRGSLHRARPRDPLAPVDQTA